MKTEGLSYDTCAAGAIDLVRSWLTAPCVIGQGAAASGVAEQADAGAAGSAAAAAGERWPRLVVRRGRL